MRREALPANLSEITHQDLIVGSSYSNIILMKMIIKTRCVL